VAALAVVSVRVVDGAGVLGDADGAVGHGDLLVG
jgi:hypothetical protein